MRLPALVTIAALFACPALASAPELGGTWVVDLSVEPGKPCTRPMQLTLRADGRADGSFCGSTIAAGRWKEDRGRLCASFRTSDGLCPYHSAVCLDGTTARCQTWAQHRDFLFNWNAPRAQP